MVGREGIGDTRLWIEGLLATKRLTIEVFGIPIYLGAEDKVPKWKPRPTDSGKPEPAKGTPGVSAKDLQMYDQ